MQLHILQELGVLKDFSVGYILEKKEIEKLHDAARVGTASKKEIEKKVTDAMLLIVQEAIKSPEKIPGVLPSQDDIPANQTATRAPLSHGELENFRSDIFYVADEVLDNYTDRMDIAAFVSILSTRLGLTEKEYLQIDWSRYDFSSLEPPLS